MEKESTERLDELEEIGAYLSGHFLLTTGRHSDRFFLMARLSERPRLMQRWAEQLANAIRPFQPAAIVGPAMGGVIPAYAVALALGGVRAMFCEKEGSGEMALKRGFRLDPGEEVVVVEDAVTTGASVAKVIAAVARAGGRVAAVAALVDRTGGRAPWPVPLLSVLSLTVKSWEPEQCPLCRAGRELTEPKR